MSPSPKRPGTQGDHDRHARARTPAGGVPVDFAAEEPTPAPIDVAPILGRTPTPDRIDEEMRELRRRHNELAEATWSVRHLPGQVDKMDRTLEKIDTRLDGFAERVVRAEDKGDAAWDTAKETMPKLDMILSQLGDVRRLADGVERTSASIEAQNKRLTAVETEQQLAAQKFELHDKRDQEVSSAVVRIEKEVAELKTARTVGDATAKIKRLVGRQRPWWWSGKGVATVLAAAAAAVATIYAAFNA